MLGFDLETTSPLPAEARIVTASIVSVQNSALFCTNWLADPGIEIPAAAAEIHGITTEHARAHGNPIADVTAEIAARLAGARESGWPVVIYNAPYDLTVLHHELTRHCGGRGLEKIGPVIDPLIIDKRVDRYRSGKRTLTAACSNYGIELAEAHTSEADAVAAMRIAWKLAKRHPEIGKMPLTELQAAQAEWHKEQQLSFADYLRRKAAQEGDESGSKQAELHALLDRADAVEAQAGSWPLRMTP